MKELIVICGPTASGKTTLAIQTAQQLNTEIISADSRQFFKEMSIGTAKPTKEELSIIPHHFIDSLSIHQSYSAGDYERDSLQLLHHLFQKHNKVICVGGSGLYIQALCEGFDQLPDIPKETREQLNESLKEKGIEHLYQELQQLDEAYAKIVNPKNPQRIIRALEVIYTSGKTYTSFRQKNTAKRPFNTTTYAIHWEREVLYERINHRVDIMLQEGLEQEAKNLYQHKDLNALQTVGYQEFFDYFDGKIDKEEAIRLIKRNSRRYAKRQITWFKRNENTIWLKPNERIKS